MSDLISPKHTADAIIARIVNRDGFTPEELKSYQESPQIYAALVEKIKTQNVETKTWCIGHFLDLGSMVEPSKEDGTLEGPPYIGNLVLIRGLVEFLGDKELDVQNRASREILDYVPDLHLRNFSKELIDRISADPNISGAADLLGKTGSERARALIRTNKVIQSESEASTKRALAKLGDSVLEAEIIESYKKENDLREKANLAHDLGFIASPRTILTLAQDLRTPLTYPWNQRAHRSFRVHVIEGLGKAYPMEPLFWRPRMTPTKDAYYQAIEEWATKNLGVTWNSPRPQFLYQIEVPMAAPRR